MADESLTRRLEPTLRPDPQRTVLRPFDLSSEADRDGKKGRLHQILEQVRAMPEDRLEIGLDFARKRIEGRYSRAAA